MEEKWDACENVDAGEWEMVKLIAGDAPRQVTTRAMKDRASEGRRTMAKGAGADDLVALQSEDDDEVNFWLVGCTHDVGRGGWQHACT